MRSQDTHHFDLSRQEPIPAAGVDAALALMRSGKLHRYGEGDGQPNAVAELEARFASELGTRYCVAVNSCGSAMFLALKCAGVQPDDAVLSNCFTLAPVPGAIAHAGARPVLVDVTEDYTIDLDDLQRKIVSSSARTLLLSHMRGHICDMGQLSEICDQHGVTLIEDCAHTMGAAWDNKPTGRWGRAACFSLQSFKHANAGEGGLLVTDDEDLAAQAILMSGSYMLYGAHLQRPSDEAMERWKYRTPNFSLRMGTLPAALALPQLGELLAERCQRWNQRHEWLASRLAQVPGLRLPQRDTREQFVASSLQFSLPQLGPARMQAFIAACAARGLFIKWFGASEPAGYTSGWRHWQFFGQTKQSLPNADRILATLCDLRLPLHLEEADCEAIGGVIRDALLAGSDHARH